MSHDALAGHCPRNAEMSLFDGGPLGPFDEKFTLAESWRGCALTFFGFILFLIVVVILVQALFK
jgi:hypothetical protein